jgi:hypothetical protein
MTEVIRVRLIKSFPELPEGLYDAVKYEIVEGENIILILQQENVEQKYGKEVLIQYKLFANTGWWLVSEEDVKEEG